MTARREWIVLVAALGAAACGAPPVPPGTDGSASDVFAPDGGAHDVYAPDRFDAASHDVPIDWTQPHCVAGDMQACTCSGGAPGEQTCMTDGTYGACVCGDGGLTDVRNCDPDSQVPCACAGGAPGVQTCDSTGSAFGSCVCNGDG
jgi:hypothetical protein